MIIKLDKNYINEVVNIEKACFASPWSYDGIEEELKNPNAYYIIYVFDRKVVGYAGMYSVCSEGYINNIAVLPEFRGRGIAKMLLNNLVQYSILNKLDFLSLEVRGSNKVAINLYSSNGFKNVGCRRLFYSKPKEDALIMTKFFNTEKW